jgi:hypothetical protein
MKKDYKYILSLAAVGLAFVACCFAGPAIIIQPPTVVISPPPPPVVVAPAPVVVVAPDDYVWDGTEYVGIVGGQYYYLGPGDVWVVCDPVRLHRFQVYVGVHPDWRTHMTHNVKYRTMDRGYHPQPQPMHDTHGQQPVPHAQPMTPGNQPGHDDRGHNGPPQ